MTGCTVKWGRQPDIAALSSKLTQGSSTKADVLAALGPPRGFGGARLPNAGEPRVLWYYEHLESDGKTSRVTTLVTFFNGEIYDGHLWLSAAVKTENRK